MERVEAGESEAPARASSGRLGFLAQVGLLLWKNLLLQRRSLKVTMAEILIPLFGAAVLVIARQTAGLTDVKKPTKWGQQDLASGATVWLSRPGQRMLYAPNSPLINSVMDLVNVSTRLYIRDLGLFPGGHIPPGWVPPRGFKPPAGIGRDTLEKMDVMGFESEEDLIQFYQLGGVAAKNYSASVIFDIDPSATSLPSHVKYTIRPRTEEGDRWYTHTAFPSTLKLSPRSGQENFYYNRSFVYAQRAITEALIRTWKPEAKINVSNMYVRRMPFPPYTNDPLSKFLPQMIPNFLVFSFVISVVFVIGSIVYEKERQIKESMKLMGMSAAAHWTSWFLQFFIYQIVISGLYTVFLTSQMSDKPAVLAKSNPSLIFVFFLLYSVSIVSFTFLVSTLVSKANTAAVLGGILFNVIHLPHYFLQKRYASMSLAQKIGASFLCNMAMSLGVTTITLHEGTGRGAQWDSLTRPASVDDNFPLSYAMGMLVVDSCILLLFTWYLDNVRPGTYGVPRPWYFPFQSSYWLGGEQKKLSVHEVTGGITDDHHFERDPRGLPVGISMIHLRKEFGKNKVAVKDSTLTMYEGQITVLLGHNGAGKTTTMSMLTGIFPPTSGTAYVNGYDIRTDINNVRGSLGLCPQYNILFDSLTVDEHLSFFARLKSCPKSEVPVAVEQMIKEVGLWSHKDARTETLSGGQKRKLSVAIALIGGSKTVILDEPTSGMDPAARRQTWDILQRHRTGRTLLLTTHFMDEADLLGDRIAIMAEGVVKCCGTSLFLKKLYGAGYHMVVEKGPQCNVANLMAVVQKQVTGAQLESEVGAELSYLLPEEEAPKFADLFRVMERQSAELGITGFGAMATTMEEVFLKVGASGISEDDKNSADVKIIISQQSVMASSATASNERMASSATVSNERMASSATASNERMASSATVSNERMTSSATATSASATNEADLSKSMAASSVDGPASTNNAADASRREHEPNGGVDNNGATKMLNEAKATDAHVVEGSNLTGQTALDTSFERLSGFRLSLSRFWGLFVKKAIHTMRNRIISVIQLSLPVIFTMAALSVDKAKPKPDQVLPLTLNLDMFHETITAYSAGAGPQPQTLALASNYSPQFSGDHKIESVDGRAFPDLNKYYLQQEKTFGVYNYSQKVVIGAEFGNCSGGEGPSVTGWYSGQPYHALPVSVAYMMNAIVKEVVGPNHSITTVNYPMPLGVNEVARESVYQANSLGLSIGLCILFGMTFLTTSMSHFVIRERQTGAKHLQVVSGGDPLTFWVASFAWDLVNYLIPCLVLLIVFASFQVEAYTEGDNLGIVFLLLIMFGLSIIPLIYLLQFLFIVPDTGFSAILSLAMVTGLLTMMIVFIMRIPYLALTKTAEVLDWVFTVTFPYFSLGTAFSNMYVNKVNQDTCTKKFNVSGRCPEYKMANQTHPCCKDSCANTCLLFSDTYLSVEYPGVGRYVSIMGAQCVVFFLLTLAIDFQLPQKLMYLYHRWAEGHRPHHGRVVSSQYPGTENATWAEDPDVTMEQQRVVAGDARGDTLVLQQLSKQYGPFVAVDGISLGVPEQECFGLLGQNGAGKTTAFKMLTGNVFVTDGDAFVQQQSIKTNLKQVQANMGYCPQFDALIDQMTGRETLTMYARLRGVPPSHIKRIVNNLIGLLMLEPHADKMTLEYSGGNKRKLSTAIALVGGPAVILLDEPSSGLDPAARRQLWNVLSQVRASGRTLMLTSHSMEECEALCTRIAIMVNGRLKCLGSPQHLKSKFGQGYTLVVKLATGADGRLAPADPLVNAIANKFPGTQKFDDHQGYVHFQVPDARVLLSEIFAAMEKARSELGVEEYSVHQTTLEQIFLAFTRIQFPPRQEGPASIFAQVCPCLS